MEDAGAGINLYFHEEVVRGEVLCLCRRWLGIFVFHRLRRRLRRLHLVTDGHVASGHGSGLNCCGVGWMGSRHSVRNT